MSELPFEKYSTYPGWRDATAKSEAHAKGKREGPNYRAIRDKRRELEKKRDKLDEQITGLSAQILDDCPHLVEHHVIEYDGREDDYGSYVSGMDFKLHCRRCGKVLEEWSKED